MSVTVLPVPRPRTIHKPYLALAGLQFLDVATTAVLLAWWTHTHEGNPLARVLTDHGTAGLYALLAFKLAAVALTWVCQTGTRLVGAVYSAVLANNLLALGLLLA